MNRCGVSGSVADYRGACIVTDWLDGVSDSLTRKEQARPVSLLVARVDDEGKAGGVTIALHPAGIQAFADEVADAPSG